MISRFILAPRFPFFLAVAAGFGLTGFGVVLTEVMHLSPCPLCIIQRMLYLLVGFLGIAGLIVGTGGRASRMILLFLLAIPAGTGAFVAGYQTWLQRYVHFASCGADYPWWEEMVDWAGERVPLLFRATGSCVEIAWSFLGFSIADWSFTIFSTLLACFSYLLFKLIKD